MRPRYRIALALVGLSGLFGVIHCGQDGTDSTFGQVDDPCETFFKGECGKDCTKDLDCAAGLYCGAGMKCTAECAPQQICSNGFVCSPRGRCGKDDDNFGVHDAGPEAGDATTDAICADTDVTLTKVVPRVLLLLDQSSSMYYFKFPSGNSNNCNPDCRWSVLKDVIIGPAAMPGGVVKEIQGEAELALMPFSSQDMGDITFLPPPTDNVCPRFNGKQFNGLSFALNNYAAIDAVLRPANVDDDTPTGPAIRTVVGLADDGGVADPRGLASIGGNVPKIIVLVTDGEPALCGEDLPSDAGKDLSVLAVQQAFAKKVRTFVIAVGDNTPQEQAHFKAVANAGQGMDPATGDASAFLPSTPQQLVDAIRQLVLDARTCTFTLNGKVQAGSEKDGTVLLNGKPVAYTPGTPANGWRLEDPSTLELVGDACTTLKATPNATLSAKFPCGAVVPITR
jgi:hypothetical protein